MVAWIMVVVECKDSHFAQGFASGDMDRDAAALRLFVDEGHTVLLAQVRSSPTEALSFSKTRLISATLCRSNSINAIDVTRVKSQMSDVKCQIFNVNAAALRLFVDEGHTVLLA